MIEVGKLAGNAIVPYSQTTKRTKEVILTATTIGSTISSQEIIGYAFADSNSAWWLHFAGRVTITTTEAILVFTLSGIQVREVSLLADGYWVGGSGAGNVGIGGAAYSFANNHTTKANHIQISPASSNSTFVFDSLIPLEAEATWAAANMEASTAASVYIEPANATKAGIVTSKNSSSTNPSGTLAGTTVSNESLEIRRIEDIVVLNLFVTVDGTSSGSTLSFTGVVPSDLRPTIYQVNNVSTATTGSLYIDEIAVTTGGNIIIYRRDWSGTGKIFLAGNYNYSISYIAEQ